jgi:hypothetical protein
MPTRISGNAANPNIASQQISNQPTSTQGVRSANPVQDLSDAFDNVAVGAGGAQPVGSSRPLDVGRIENSPIYPGINETNADWARTRVLTHALLDITQGSREPRSVSDVMTRLEQSLSGHGFTATPGEVDRLLGQLSSQGIIRREGDSVSLAADPRVIATQAHAARFVRTDLERGLARIGADPLGRDQLAQALFDYGRAADLWPLDPVESRGALLKAIAKMSQGDRASLARFIDDNPELLQLTAIDDVRLSLDPLNPRADWVQRNAPSLAGREVVMASIEDDLVVGGGLGRVFGYESDRMNRLLSAGAQSLPENERPSFVTLSPMYDYRFNRGNATPLDYAEMGVENLQVVRQFEVNLEDEGIARAEILTGRTRDGINRIFVRDPDGRHTAALYQYDQSARNGDGVLIQAGDWEDAVDFFGSAAAGYVRERAVDGAAREGNNYRGMVVQGNDGQSALVIGYLGNSRRTEGGALNQVFLTSKTHTINNRGPNVIEGWALPDSMNELAARIGTSDPTSLMLRSGTPQNNGRPIGQAVSSVHAAQMRVIDPNVDLYAVTNGTKVEEFQRRFLSVLPENQRPSSPAVATSEDLTRARLAGKQRLANELNEMVPENLRMNAAEIEQFQRQTLLVFSGRGVDEKIGASENQIFNDLALQERGDRTTPRNIESMLRRGINVVLYANAQAFQRSQDIFNGLVALQNEYAAARPQWVEQAQADGGPTPGRLVVRSGWGPEEQWRLHAAADISVQVSDTEQQAWSAGVPVKTEANGATEVPDFISGNLKLTTPEIHGGMNTLTELVNWSDPAEGSVIIPDEYSAPGFLAAVLRANEEFVERPEDAATRRLAAFQEARSTDSVVTAAADLRLFNQVVQST